MLWFEGWGIATCPDIIDIMEFKFWFALGYYNLVSISFFVVVVSLICPIVLYYILYMQLKYNKMWSYLYFSTNAK